ncbi:hypothetical protein [Rhodovulum steppense]|uniref:Lipoprotein n=1 Tax=Rhodovulum steppense TaxID=540251 RepID=A0A4R1YWJ1_9RHOB|nr:hypothetical protein [Rhodovulum steppense]TCM85540.1 hypothetical protein EV216_107114 [Rhodovulum steppense]
MFSTRVLFGSTALMLAAACQPTTEQLVKQGKPIELIYPTKSGVTAAGRQKDFTNCRIEAAQRVPQHTMTRTTPTYTTPIQTQCYNYGYTVSCNTTGGQTYGGNTYTYDANLELRAAAEAQCLHRKGYTLTTIPKCPPGEKTKPVREQLYALSRNTCYVADEKGNYAVTEKLR